VAVALAATTVATSAVRSSLSADREAVGAGSTERAHGGSVDRPLVLTGFVLAAAAAALALALHTPIATIVIGLVLFGILHNFLEIRYVTGRFPAILSRSFLELLAVLVTGVVVCRLLEGVVGRPAQVAEIGLGYVVLAVGAQRGLEGGRKVAVWAALVPAAVVSLAWPAYHFVVLSHLHNLVPLVFLWGWADRIRSEGGRRAFLAAQVLWVVAVPLVILSGALDGLLTTDVGIVGSLVGDGHSVLAATAPPGQAATVLGMRFLTVFAFLQAMHYVVWVWFMPRYAPDASAAFEARVPWLTGARVWAVGFIVAAVFGVLFVVDFTQGKALYAAVASYHVYLEFPVLLALLVGGRALSAPAGAAPMRAKRPLDPTHPSSGHFRTHPAAGDETRTRT
jgi:hypothetical protein